MGFQGMASEPSIKQFLSYVAGDGTYVSLLGLGSCDCSDQDVRKAFQEARRLLNRNRNRNPRIDPHFDFLHEELRKAHEQLGSHLGREAYKAALKRQADTEAAAQLEKVVRFACRNRVIDSAQERRIFGIAEGWGLSPRLTTRILREQMSVSGAVRGDSAPSLARSEDACFDIFVDWALLRQRPSSGRLRFVQAAAAECGLEKEEIVAKVRARASLHLEQSLPAMIAQRLQFGSFLSEADQAALEQYAASRCLPREEARRHILQLLRESNILVLPAKELPTAQARRALLEEARKILQVRGGPDGVLIAEDFHTLFEAGENRGLPEAACREMVEAALTECGAAADKENELQAGPRARFLATVLDLFPAMLAALALLFLGAEFGREGLSRFLAALPGIPDPASLFSAFMTGDLLGRLSFPFMALSIYLIAFISLLALFLRLRTLGESAMGIVICDRRTLGPLPFGRALLRKMLDLLSLGAATLISSGPVGTPLLDRVAGSFSVRTDSPLYRRLSAAARPVSARRIDGRAYAFLLFLAFTAWVLAGRAVWSNVAIWTLACLPFDIALIRRCRACGHPGISARLAAVSIVLRIAICAGFFVWPSDGLSLAAYARHPVHLLALHLVLALEAIVIAAGYSYSRGPLQPISSPQAPAHLSTPLLDAVEGVEVEQAAAIPREAPFP